MRRHVWARSIRSIDVSSSLVQSPMAYEEKIADGSARLAEKKLGAVLAPLAVLPLSGRLAY
jgi:hypothetical protein